MRHKESIRHLPDFGMGVLDPAVESSVASHVSRCAACQGWLATRELLAEGIGEADGPDDHPDSSVLAHCVVRPEEVHEPGLEEVRRHLGNCPTCRRSVDLLTRAVREARPHTAAAPHEVLPSLLGAAGRKLALAAAVALILIGAGVVLTVALKPSSADGPGEAMRLPAPLRSDLSQEPRIVDSLAGEDLEGASVIRNDRKLTVSNVTVKSGADVTLEAGDVVVLGDGFRVASGARLRVASGRAGAPVPELDERGTVKARAAGKG